jgi:carboxymethylenebutenolidase
MSGHPLLKNIRLNRTQATAGRNPSPRILRVMAGLPWTESAVSALVLVILVVTVIITKRAVYEQSIVSNLAALRASKSGMSNRGSVESLFSTNARVTYVPTRAGGHGREHLSEFYNMSLGDKASNNLTWSSVSRAVTASGVIVDELILSFTHTTDMPWILPHVAPTNRAVKVPAVSIVVFDSNSQIVSERVYWDQASVLLQVGKLKKKKDIPITGPEQADHVERDMT